MEWFLELSIAFFGQENSIMNNGSFFDNFMMIFLTMVVVFTFPFDPQPFWDICWSLLDFLLIRMFLRLHMLSNI